jgi:uncharacterized protein (TIGR02147 family)
MVPVLKLRGASARYFVTLAHIASARTLSEKGKWLAELEELRRRRGKSAAVVEDNALFRHWYVAAIWELASCAAVKKLTPKLAAEALQGKIGVQEAKEAIEFLLARGYLREKDGKLVPSETFIISSDGKTDQIVRLNHRQTVSASLDAIELPIEDRGFYGLTLAFSKRRLPQVKARLKQLIQDLQAEFALDPEADTVYRINAHCFPLSTTLDSSQSRAELLAGSDNQKATTVAENRTVCTSGLNGQL